MNFAVLVNERGEYRVWRLGRGIPAGWRAAGFEGDKNACIEFIEEREERDADSNGESATNPESS